MKVTHVLGHNPNWNIDIYNQQGLGDYHLITAFSHGSSFDTKNNIKSILDKSMLDLQFYGKKESINRPGKLETFPFHPIHCDGQETSVYFENCIKQAIKYQEDKGFDNIIIPHFYEREETDDIISTIKNINKYLSKHEKKDRKYFMTLPFANHVILDENKVEEILFACTDMDIVFDGYFITCENKPFAGQKLSVNFDLIKNLSKVLKTLKNQDFETIYAYANFDAIIYLAQTDIDYITIGTFENLRNFDIRRYTVDQSGGPSKGYYFSKKLLNSVKADDITIIRRLGALDTIRNQNNIFSDAILIDGFSWSSQKPDINKNYLLSVGQLLKDISNITNLDKRKEYVLNLIEDAIDNYKNLQNKNIFLSTEGENYHLNIWKSYLLSAN